MDREAWRAVIHGVTKSRTQLSNWSDLLYFSVGFLGGSDSKEPACNVGPGFDPWIGKIPWKGHDNSIQYFCLENPNGQKTLAGCSPWNRKESDMTYYSFILLSYAMLWRKLPAEGQHKYGVHFIYFPFLKDFCSVCPMPKNSYFISIGQNICIISFCTCYIQEDKSNTYHFLMSRIQVFSIVFLMLFPV